MKKDRLRALKQRDRERDRLEPWSPESQKQTDELAKAWEEFGPTWETATRKPAMFEQMWLYFIQEGSVGPIKIGLAHDVSRRLRELQCGNTRPLELLAAVLTRDICSDGYLMTPREVEADTHRRFADLRVTGEWFQPHERLLSLIDLQDERAVA